MAQSPFERVVRLVAALSLAAGLGACATSTPVCEAGAQTAISSWLYFGAATPDGPATAEAWQGFVDDTITPRFPDGFSVWPASGQWRMKDHRIVREDSFIVSVVHTGSTVDRRALDDIVASYKSRFRQEAVLHTQAPVCSSF